jgi:single-stranded DNA-binding protein
MRIMASGIIHDAPTLRTSSNGNTFTVAKLRDDSTNPTAWLSLVAFAELGEVLAKQEKGASVAISGKGTVEVYTPAGGDPRPNISITVDQLTTLKGARH